MNNFSTHQFADTTWMLLMWKWQNDAVLKAHYLSRGLHERVPVERAMQGERSCEIWLVYKRVGKLVIHKETSSYGRYLNQIRTRNMNMQQMAFVSIALLALIGSVTLNGSCKRCTASGGHCESRFNWSTYAAITRCSCKHVNKLAELLREVFPWCKRSSDADLWSWSRNVSSLVYWRQF